jgi:hypothetical protein
MNKIKSMKCDYGHVRTNFYLRHPDDGKYFFVDKNGIITFTYTDKVKEGNNIFNYPDILKTVEVVGAMEREITE